MGYDDGVAAKWRKVKAIEGEPRCEGVVESAGSATTFVLVTGGFANLDAHGYAVGPLYLSQATVGLGTSTVPVNGVERRIGTVVDADYVNVLQLPEFAT